MGAAERFFANSSSNSSSSTHSSSDSSNSNNGSSSNSRPAFPEGSPGVRNRSVPRTGGDSRTEANYSHYIVLLQLLLYNIYHTIAIV